MLALQMWITLNVTAISGLMAYWWFVERPFLRGSVINMARAEEKFDANFKALRDYVDYQIAGVRRDIESRLSR